MKRFKLIDVLRPQPEFSAKAEGNIFEIDETRLVKSEDGKWSLPNPHAGPMSPESIALFEEAN